jgi:hypothetical protein
MLVEVVLAPRHQVQLSGQLADVYDSRSKDYHRWLAK